jgi:transposase-like protein
MGPRAGRRGRRSAGCRRVTTRTSRSSARGRTPPRLVYNLTVGHFSHLPRLRRRRCDSYPQLAGMPDFLVDAGYTRSDVASVDVKDGSAAVPKPYPREFRDDVVRVARDRDPSGTVEQIAQDFGVHPMTLSKWLRQAEADEGSKPRVSGGESAELREARRRTCPRPVFREKALPARERAGRCCDSRGGDVPGAQDRSSALLPLAGPAGHRC